MAKRLPDELGKRERQIAEAVYRLGEASVSQVLEAIPDAPGYSSVRATMNILARKGVLVFRKDGKKFVYRPALPPEAARATAVRRLLRTYFENSVAGAVSALLSMKGERLTDEEYRQLSRLIESRKKDEG